MSNVPEKITLHVVDDGEGFHVRIVGENGEIVFTSENYTSKQNAFKSVAFVTSRLDDNVEVTMKNVKEAK